MKPLRACFISVVPAPYQRDLFAALARRSDVEIDAFYLEAAAPDSPWPEKPLAPYERYLPGFWFPLGSRRCHVNWPLPNFSRYDVVVLNTLMSVTAQYLMRGALRRKPWIFWGERLSRGGRLHRLLSSPLHRAAAIAGIGSAAAADYAARFPEPKSFNIPYHCEIAAFRDAPRPVRPARETVFLFCGQMIARKGVDHLLAAFAALDESARLLLVGREAELPSLLSTVPAAVRSRIEYAGFQAPEALPAFFARADVFILPSRYDGWGVVVNQALGAGLPLICSDQVGAAGDLIETGVNGLIFAAEDAKDLRDKMQRFLDDRSLIAAYGRASAEKAEAWHPESGAAKWAAALHSVAS